MPNRQSALVARSRACFCALHVRSICARSIRAPAPSASAAAGTSCANKRSPSGSIQSPSTGRKLRNAADDQQNGERNPGVARRRLAQPADEPRRPRRQLASRTRQSAGRVRSDASLNEPSPLAGGDVHCDAAARRQSVARSGLEMATPSVRSRVRSPVSPASWPCAAWRSQPCAALPAGSRSAGRPAWPRPRPARDPA